MCCAERGMPVSVWRGVYPAVGPQVSAGPKESSGEESPRPPFQVSGLLLMVSRLLVGHVGYCSSNNGGPHAKPDLDEWKGSSAVPG